MQIIRPATLEDAQKIAEIHATSIDTGFISSLPRGFIVMVYKEIISSKNAFTFVSQNESEVIGFICCAKDTRVLFREIIQKKGLILALLLMRYWFDLDVIWKIINNIIYPKKFGRDIPRAEILSMAVSEAGRGRGFGRQLLLKAMENFKNNKITGVRVSTDEKNEWSNKFYFKNGFLLKDRIKHYKHYLNVYVIDLLPQKSASLLGNSGKKRLIEDIALSKLEINNATMKDHCEAYKKVKLNGFWWYQFNDMIFGNYSKPFNCEDKWLYHVKPGLAWLIDPFCPYSDEEIRKVKLPYKDSFVGYQLGVKERKSGNSNLVINVIDDLSEYNFELLDQKRRNSIRKGDKSCLIIKIEKEMLNQELIGQICLVWTSFVKRTGWKTDKNKEFITNSWKELLDVPGNNIYGCFGREDGKMLAWLIVKCLDDCLYVDTIASHDDYLKRNVNGIMLYAVLKNASQQGVKHAHYALKSYIITLENFKQSMGFEAQLFPTILSINFPFNILGRIAFKKQFRRMIGGGGDSMKAKKRLLDLSLSIIGIFLSSPLWLLIILIIVLDDGWPVFFFQERVGKNGKIFKVIKFRTMKRSTVPHKDIDLLDQDYRVTRVGQRMRALAVDELPQLISIFKGDMSFVGPRALPMQIDDKITHKYNRLDQIPGYDIRIKILPGLTGLSQIFDTKSMSLEDKFKRDIEYIEKMSFWLDLKLIFLSFWITFRGTWEKRTSKL